jgi:succinate dehydrogenase / fumarate reductase iron-sulfur subunit
MVAQLDKEGFGACTNTGACEAACPKEISIANIARLNKEYIVAGLTSE